jgi:hypothetical protein
MQSRTVTVMYQSHLHSAGEGSVEPMIALARCSKLQRIIVAGSKSVELMFDLETRGYVHVAATANCGRPAGQYDVALVDWRGRALKNLETTLDWLIDYLCREGVLVVWADHSEPEAHESLRSALECHGFVIENGTVREGSSGVSARRRDVKPIPEAA